MAVDTTDTDLGAPLLEDHDITLNGDPINLRDLQLLGGSPSATLNIHDEQEETTPRTQCATPASALSGDSKSTASNERAEESESSPGSTTDPSTTLSLDDNRSSFTTTDQNFTRRGQSLYYRAKRKLSNIVEALTTTRNENNNIRETNGGENNSMRLLSQKSSLSSSKSTSPFLKLLIPPLLIFNHFLFYQGQTKVSKVLSTFRSNLTHMYCKHGFLCTNINAHYKHSRCGILHIQPMLPSPLRLLQ